jgi:signal peptidase I
MKLKIKPLSILSYAFLTLVLLLAFMRVVFFEQYTVAAGSMKPALAHGDVILCWKYVFARDKEHRGRHFHLPLERGDIVIIQLPGERDMIIKRITGMPGDCVEISEHAVLVNDEHLYKSADGGGKPYRHEIIEIPDNHFFVLGDNLKNSRDSREFGTIKKENIVGKVFLIYFPFDRFKVF